MPDSASKRYTPWLRSRSSTRSYPSASRCFANMPCTSPGPIFLDFVLTMGNPLFYHPVETTARVRLLDAARAPSL